jgi:hypothetical protein
VSDAWQRGVAELGSREHGGGVPTGGEQGEEAYLDLAGELGGEGARQRSAGESRARRRRGGEGAVLAWSSSIRRGAAPIGGGAARSGGKRGGAAPAADGGREGGRRKRRGGKGWRRKRAARAGGGGRRQDEGRPAEMEGRSGRRDLRLALPCLLGERKQWMAP